MKNWCYNVDTECSRNVIKDMRYQVSMYKDSRRKSKSIWLQVVGQSKNVPAFLNLIIQNRIDLFKTDLVLHESIPKYWFFDSFKRTYPFTSPLRRFCWRVNVLYCVIHEVFADIKLNVSSQWALTVEDLKIATNY